MLENIREKIEDRIIDLINSSSGGRLVIFKPEKSDMDLVVEKKGDYKRSPVSLKIYDKDELSQKEDSAVDDNLYLLFLHFDMVKQDIEDDVWIKDKTSKFLINKNDIGKFFVNKFGK